jgi:hypothetical protein
MKKLIALSITVLLLLSACTTDVTTSNEDGVYSSFTRGTENADNDFDDDHKYGNSQYNLQQCGYFAESNGWTYFESNGLLKQNNETNEIIRITDEQIYGINVIDDYVFYVGFVMKNQWNIQYTTINSMRIDGTEHSIITDTSDDESVITGLVVVDDWCYYTTNEEPRIGRYAFDYSTIYKIRTDGTEKSEITVNGSIQAYVIAQDYIYFCGTINQVAGIYRMDADGSDIKLIFEDEFGYDSCSLYDLQVVKDKIYFIRNYGGNPIGSVGIEGDYLTYLMDSATLPFSGPPMVHSFIVDNDWIYYIEFKQDSSACHLNKMTIYGTEKTFLKEITMEYSDPELYFANGWIFTSQDDYDGNGSRVYNKISTDGETVETFRTD